MTCRSSFTDGDRRLRTCAQPEGHDGLHADGQRVSWNGSWVGDHHFDGNEDQ